MIRHGHVLSTAEGRDERVQGLLYFEHSKRKKKISEGVCYSS